jgi:hypothetical protein
VGIDTRLTGTPDFAVFVNQRLRKSLVFQRFFAAQVNAQSETPLTMRKWRMPQDLGSHDRSKVKKSVLT